MVTMFIQPYIKEINQWHGYYGQQLEKLPTIPHLYKRQSGGQCQEGQEWEAAVWPDKGLGMVIMTDYWIDGGY